MNISKMSEITQLDPPFENYCTLYKVFTLKIYLIIRFKFGSVSDEFIVLLTSQYLYLTRVLKKPYLFRLQWNCLKAQTYDHI